MEEKTYLLLRVIQRRIDSGESFEKIILDYPKITNKEIEEIKKIIK